MSRESQPHVLGGALTFEGCGGTLARRGRVISQATSWEETIVAYTAEISQRNPTCFVFLIDRSGSMRDPFGADVSKRKTDGVADAVNRLLQTLVFRCAKGETILDRYYIGLIGYGGHVESALGGELAGQGLVPVSQVGNHPLRVDTRVKKIDDGAGGLLEQTVRFPIWFDPVAEGGTPMCEAIGLAQEVIGQFLEQFPHCFPPIVINITDGEATDGDPEPAAAALRSAGSTDGNVLMFNVHISDVSVKPIRFPEDESCLPDDHARRLFRMSSALPQVLLEQARGMDVVMKEGTRGFVFNGDLVSVIQLLDIGTRVDKNR